MDVLLGVLSLTGFSLLFAKGTGRSSALGPLVAVSGAILWFTIWGCVNLLQVGGWLWYLLALLAWGWLIVKQKKEVSQLFTPGLWFFILGSLFFVLLFFFTKPLMTQWDEFTFWGTAGKVVTDSNQLYTLARSNLFARSYPPGMAVFGYMMQFFGGGFAEYKFIAAYAVLYLAGFASASALWGRNKAGATVMLAGLFMLPLFFELSAPAGRMMYAYLSVMGDMAMAVLFGGALCLYYGGGEKSARLLLPFALVLAALTSVKDMGLALGLIALFVAALDMILGERDRLHFWRLQRWKAWLVSCLAGFAAVAGAYLLWTVHMALAPGGSNRFNLGSGGENLGQLAMLSNGFKALFGIVPDEKFTDIARLMLEAFVKRPVFLLGSSLVMLLLIVMILAATWILSGTKRQRKRILVFLLAMLFCFCAFYLFNIFTYTYILKDVESYMLKDFDRYINPFWIGWLMAALVLLSRATQDEKSLRFRLRAARGASIVLAGLFILSVGARVNSRANFMRISPSLYTHRWDVQQVVEQAQREGMAPEDRVYTISQGDDSSRFYLFAYEMPSELSMMFEGMGENEEGKLVALKNTSVSFVPPGQKETSQYVYKAEVTPESWAAFLKEQDCTHVLLDVIDEYILEDFGPMFSDGLKGWVVTGEPAAGHRYYEIQWRGDKCVLVPAQGGGS